MTSHFVPDCVCLQIAEGPVVSGTMKTLTVYLTRILELWGPRLVGRCVVLGPMACTLFFVIDPNVMS